MTGYVSLAAVAAALCRLPAYRHDAPDNSELTYYQGVFGADVDYAMPVKVYGQTGEGERRYGQPECVGCYGKKIEGNPDARHVSTSLQEEGSAISCPIP